jgi:predicted porin
MNKKLLAVAVAGAFVAPAAALAQSSTVQVYGKATVEYGYADQGNSTATVGRPNTDIFQTPGGSAVGFRGEEKLGGGLSAWFQCETSADVRGLNQDGMCSRNSAIGMKGGWGNLHFGRWDTPFKRATVGMIGGGDTGLLGLAFLMAGNSTGTGAIGGIAPQSLSRGIWKRRETGLIYYESPSFNGFQVLGAFSAANATSSLNTSTAQKPRVLSLAGTYANGPLSLGLGYERHNSFGAVGGSNDDRGWTLGGTYTFMGTVKLGMQYADYKYETTAVQDLKKKTWMVGLEWNIQGPHNLDASYVRAGNSTGTATAAGGSVAPGSGVSLPSLTGLGTGAKLYQIAYRHEFSKRTSAKLGYVRLNNDDGAAYALGGLSSAVAGDNQSAWVMYAQHTW